MTQLRSPALPSTTQCATSRHTRLQDHKDGALAVVLLVNTQALLPVGGEGSRTRVVTGNADESAMLIEERRCTARAVDHHRHRRLPALEVLRVRVPLPIIRVAAA